MLSHRDQDDNFVKVEDYQRSTRLMEQSTFDESHRSLGKHTFETSLPHSDDSFILASKTLTKEEETVDRRNSTKLQSFMNVAKLVFGNVWLSLPHVFAQTGWLGGLRLVGWLLGLGRLKGAGWMCGCVVGWLRGRVVGRLGG